MGWRSRSVSPESGHSQAGAERGCSRATAQPGHFCSGSAAYACVGARKRFDRSGLARLTSRPSARSPRSVRRSTWLGFSQNSDAVTVPRSRTDDPPRWSGVPKGVPKNQGTVKKSEHWRGFGSPFGSSPSHHEFHRKPCTVKLCGAFLQLRDNFYKSAAACGWPALSRLVPYRLHRALEAPGGGR